MHAYHNMQCNMKEETRLVTEETPTEFSAALSVENAGLLYVILWSMYEHTHISYVLILNVTFRENVCRGCHLLSCTEVKGTRR